jgi:ferredoxin
VDGKAKIDMSLCDGLGACLKECPRGAITIEEEKVVPQKAPCGCPSMKIMELKPKSVCHEGESDVGRESELRNWPVQLKLVPPFAPYLNDADILIAADCVPFACANFHGEILRKRVLLVGCPKLDDLDYYAQKIGDIVKSNSIKSITYARMEVPCCAGLSAVINEVIKKSGKNIPYYEIVIGINGKRA